MSLLFELSFFPDCIFTHQSTHKICFIGNRIWGTQQTWWAAWTNPYCRLGTYSTSNNVYCTIIVNNREVTIVWFDVGKDIFLLWYKLDLGMVKRLGFLVEIGHYWVTVIIGEHLGSKFMYWWPRDDWCLCGVKNLNLDLSHTCRDKHNTKSTLYVFPWEPSSFCARIYRPAFSWKQA